MKERKLFCISMFIIMCCLIRVVLGQVGVLDNHLTSQIEKINLSSEKVTLAGRIYKIEQSEKNQVLYLKDISISYQNQSLKKSRIIIYSLDYDTPLAIGNRIICCGEIRDFAKKRNPGSFNQQVYYQQQKIDGYLVAEHIEVQDETTAYFLESLRFMKVKGTEICRKYAGDTYGGILSAMLVGERAFVDRDIKELYQCNGIAHILAVSGLHLSFLGNCVYQSVRKISGSYFWGGIIGFGVLGCYSLMLGFQVSAIRALVMLSVRIGADMSGRVYDPATSIALSAAIVSMLRPFVLLDGGFQLSYGAIIGIYYVSPILTRRAKKKMLFWESVKGSLAIQMMTLPILLYHFYEVPIYSIFTNLLVIPFVSVLLVLAIVALGCSFLWEPAAVTLFALCKAILQGYTILCENVLELPCARILWGRPGWLGMMVYYGIIILLIEKGKSLYGLKRILLLGASLGIVCLSSPRGRAEELEITMLDVGQGDCICLHKDESVYLIDGGSTSKDQIGKYQIEPFLKEKGIAEIDGVFLSHGDADHINGILELLERQKVGIRIRCLVVTEIVYRDEAMLKLVKAAKNQGVSTMVMKEGEKLQVNDLSIICLYPKENDVIEAGNEASMVLDVSYRGFDMLFTGDLEGIGEEILAGKLKKQYDVLKVSHHGSGNATKEAFLNKVKPEYALISAGENNRYGHPHSETLERLSESGCKIYSTIESGAIMVKTDGEKMIVEEYVKEKE